MKFPLHDSHLTHPEFSLRQEFVGEYHLHGPESERQAAKLVTPRVTGQAMKVLGEIAASRQNGLTGWEICDRTRMLRGSVSRSLTQLKNAGLIEVVGTRKEHTGAKARVFVASDAGVRQVRRAS